LCRGGVNGGHLEEGSGSNPPPRTAPARVSRTGPREASVAEASRTVRRSTRAAAPAGSIPLCAAQRNDGNGGMTRTDPEGFGLRGQRGQLDVRRLLADLPSTPNGCRWERGESLRTTYRARPPGPRGALRLNKCDVRTKEGQNKAVSQATSKRGSLWPGSATKSKTKRTKMNFPKNCCQ